MHRRGRRARRRRHVRVRHQRPPPAAHILRPAELCGHLKALQPDSQVPLSTLSTTEGAAREIADGSNTRLFFQRLCARVTRTSVARLHLSPLTFRFFAVGMGNRFRGDLAGPRTPVGLTGIHWSPGTAVGLGCLLVFPFGLLAKGILLLLAIVVSCTQMQPGTGRLLLPATRAFFGRVFRSLRGGKMATAVTCGPDGSVCMLLLSLLTHLAGYARSASDSEGGVLLDTEYAELLQSAPEQTATIWSSTYRMEMGSAVPGPRRIRLVHLVCPEGGPDPLRWCTLARAARVWLVLPCRTSPEADLQAAALAAAAPADSITVILDGPENTLDHWPATRDALAGRPHQLFRADLWYLREQYFAGRITPEEAGAAVRSLLGGGEPPRPAPDTATQAEGAARRPDTQGGRHERA